MEGAKPKGASLREEDVLLLLNKYSITTILNLLKEVHNRADCPKLDWDALVKESCTGISSAIEYQMLWRHVAYQTPFLEKLEAVAEPLDDDSDLDYELETCPSISSETLAEATSAVKILIAAGSVHEQGPNRATGEAMLTSGSNGQAPSVIRQTQLSASSLEAVDVNGAAGPAKKKRKLWTKEEDLELIAAVDKCGEGNWANILKGDFKHNRTASQLSQRWSIIRKKRANLSMGSGSNPPGSATTEAHMATWQAVNMAIKMPITGSLSTRRPGTTGGPQSADLVSSPAAPTATAMEPAAVVSSPETAGPSQPPPTSTLQKTALLSNPPSKPRANPKVTTVKPTSNGLSSIIQAAAIAAGGRIAPPSTAASHFKAAQSKNAVHIRPGGSLLPSSSVPGSKSTPSMTSASRCSKTPVSPLRSTALSQQGASGLSGQPTCDGFSLVESKVLEEDLGKNMDTDPDENIKADLVTVKGEKEEEVDEERYSERGKSEMAAMIIRENGGEVTECRDGSTGGDHEEGKLKMGALNRHEDERKRSEMPAGVLGCDDSSTAAEDIEIAKSENASRQGSQHDVMSKDLMEIDGKVVVADD